MTEMDLMDTEISTIAKLLRESTEILLKDAPIDDNNIDSNNANKSFRPITPLPDLKDIEFELNNTVTRPSTPFVLPRKRKIENDFTAILNLTIIAASHEKKMIIPNQAFSELFVKRCFTNILAKRSDTVQTYATKLLYNHRLSCFDAAKEHLMVTINLHGLGNKLILPNGSNMLEPVLLSREEVYTNLASAAYALTYNSFIIIDSSCANLDTNTIFRRKEYDYSDRCIQLIKRPAEELHEYIHSYKHQLLSCNHKNKGMFAMTLRSDDRGYFYTYISDSGKTRHELDLARMYVLARYYLFTVSGRYCDICVAQILNNVFRDLSIIVDIKQINPSPSNIREMAYKLMNVNEFNIKNNRFPGCIACPCGLHFCNSIE